MKICFIANVNSIHARRWISPLIEQGHQVYVVSYREHPPDIAGVAELVDLTQSKVWGKLRFFQWGVGLRKYLAKIQPDILHAHQIQAAGWMGALTNYHPFVVSGWGSDILVEPHKSRFRKCLVEYVLSKTDYLTVPSRIMYNEAIRLGCSPLRLRLIPWGIETDVFFARPHIEKSERAQFGFGPGQKIVLFPRRISPICNLDILLKAFAEVLDSEENIKLVLLRFQPDDAYLKRIENQILASSLSQHILWLDELRSPQEMAKLYRAVDIVVSIPSSEGYGFSVYEAMACGTPTIITDLPVFDSELVQGKDTLKVPVGDVQKTKCALLNLLQNEELRQIIAQNGLQAVGDKSVSNRIRQVDDLYNHILNI